MPLDPKHLTGRLTAKHSKYLSFQLFLSFSLWFPDLRLRQCCVVRDVRNYVIWYYLPWCNLCFGQSPRYMTHLYRDRWNYSLHASAAIVSPIFDGNYRICCWTRVCTTEVAQPNKRKTWTCNNINSRESLRAESVRLHSNNDKRFTSEVLTEHYT